LPFHRIDYPQVAAPEASRRYNLSDSIYIRFVARPCTASSSVLSVIYLHGLETGVPLGCFSFLTGSSNGFFS